MKKKTHEAEWTPFQTHYFSDNLVTLGIDPGPLDLQSGTLTTRPLRRSQQNEHLTNVEILIFKLMGTYILFTN
jgi:hypothetical protein